MRLDSSIPVVVWHGTPTYIRSQSVAVGPCPKLKVECGADRLSRQMAIQVQIS